MRIKLTLLLTFAVAFVSLFVFSAQANAFFWLLFGCDQKRDICIKQEVTLEESDRDVFINPTDRTVWYQGWPARGCWLYEVRETEEAGDGEIIVGYVETIFRDEGNVERRVVHWIVAKKCTYRKTLSGP